MQVKMNNAVRQIKFKKQSLCSVLMLVLIWVVMVQCGGASSGVTDSSTTIDTGNLKPEPKVHTKWVYEIEQNGEKTRMAKEIIQLSNNSWQEIDLYEGVPQAPTRTRFKVIDGKAYASSVSAVSGTYSYSEPGQRLKVEPEELPFSESYQWAYLGPSGIGAATQKRTYKFLGNENFSVGFVSYPVVHMLRTSEVQNQSGGFDVFENRELWESQELGLVKERMTESSGVETIKVLKSFQLSSDITVSNNEVKSASSQMVLTLSSAIPSDTPEAVFREIYDLALTHPQSVNKGRLSLSLAQGSHLYHRYYLYKNRHPSNYANISNVQDLVTHFGASDPYTFYFSEEQYSSFLNQISGSKSFVGLRLGVNDASVTDVNTVISNSNKMTVLEVTPLSRAWYDGFLKGDVIKKIDSTSVEGLSYEAVLDLFPSTEAKAVVMQVDRGGTTIEINTASETHIAQIMNSNVAYLNVRKFTTTTGTEVQKDFEALKTTLGGNPSGIILDLRYNSGGSTSGARALIDYLIDNDSKNQNIIYRISNNTQKYYLGNYATENIGAFDSTNLVVLINEESASASEVTAGVMKHYGKGKLIGKKSFGKGVSQSLFGLMDGSGLAITNQEILLPNDIAYHGKGVSPDIVYSTAPTSLSSDLQLQAALEFLSSGNVTGAESSSKASLHKQISQKDPWIPHFLKHRH